MGYSGRMGSLAGRVATAVVALAVIAAGGGCRNSTSEQGGPPPAVTSTPDKPARDASAGDVAFLQNMIKHHEQALDLSALVPSHTDNDQIMAVMQRVAGQQRAEMDGFRAQLLQWEEPLAAPRGAHIDGMLDQAAIDKLQSLHGADFDTLWLQSMIAHHRGAVTMAQAEIAHGQSPDVVSIARSVAASQQAEVDRMEQLLKELE